MAEGLGEVLASLSEKFGELRTSRMMTEDYAKAISFFGDDVFEEFINTLADTANLCELQAIKLMLLQGQLEDEVGSKLNDGGIQVGLKAFVRSDDAWKNSDGS